MRPTPAAMHPWMGMGPTPDLITAAQDYSRRFGATNPGEVASLDDFILRGQDRAQDNKVQGSLSFSSQASSRCAAASASRNAIT